jgi:hypothetical protein
LDSVPLTAVVLAKLCAGALPTKRPSQVWAGESKGATCDACDHPIPPRAIEYEVEIANLGVFRFHRECFDVWHQERAWYLEHQGHRSTALAEGGVGARQESSRADMFRQLTRRREG